MFSWTTFEKVPIVGIIRNLSANDFEKLLPLYIEAGFTTIEVTINTVGAESMIKKAKTDFGNSIHVGAGTVCYLQDLQGALEAGADFIVTPIVVKDVIEQCVSVDVPVVSSSSSSTSSSLAPLPQQKYLQHGQLVHR